jgi:uncharacterized RDD family membrane protein YckC
MSEIVTGDAVVLDLGRAEPASRAVAFALDVAVMAVAYLLLLAVLVTSLTDVDGALAAGVALSLLVLVFVVYPVTVETLTRGRSLGKAAVGLRVVRTDGGPIRFRQALVRGLAGFVVDFGVFSFFTGAIGLISALTSAHGQRVGDRLAGTVVVRERLPVTVGAPIVMPPPLATWARGLELTALPDDLALAARQFLVRAARLDGVARVRLAGDLATRVAAHVGPPPPPGTPPEPYLAAVLSERRRRDEVRLATRTRYGPVAAAPPPRPGPPAPQPTPPPGATGFALPR